MQTTEMRFSCPNCATEYDVPDAALAGRARRLRCAKCGHEWRVGQGVSDAVPVARPAPDAHTHSWSPLPAEPERNSGSAEPERNPGSAEPERNDGPAEGSSEPHFGRPVDEAARADIEQAVQAEEKSANQGDAPKAEPPKAEPSKADENEGLPLFLTPAGQSEAKDEGAEQDRFAALIRAARDKSIQFEPEPKPVPRVNTTSPILFGGLVLVFIVLCVLLFGHLHPFGR